MSPSRLSTSHALRHWSFVLATGCLLPLAASAAPTTDVPGTAQTQAPAATSLGPAGVQSGARNSDTRTIDLLMEMQQPTAGIQFNERSARGSSRDGQVRTAQAAQTTQSPQQRSQLEAPQTPPSGLFGSGATPAVQTGSQNLAERATGGDSAPPRVSGRPSSDLPPEIKRWLQWPREVASYVRENRGFVAACIATLLLMGWAASMMFSRRRG